jgi:hypothetical protein
MDGKKLDTLRAPAVARGAKRAAISSARMEVLLAKRGAVRRRDNARTDRAAIERLLERRAGLMETFARNK